jgi:hypothetical protein
VTAVCELWRNRRRPARLSWIGTWNCSQKQRELIEKIGKENNLDQNALDSLAGKMFGATVQALNKLQASGLIDALLDQYGKRNQREQDGRRYVGRSNVTTKGATI